ncbi:MAG: hypothetical protein AAF192_05875 [Pseudomonadota bacterium]
MLRAAIVLLAAAGAARADTVVGPEAFEALTEGRVMIYTHQGEPFGAEQYLPDRRVLWQRDSGGCLQGVWFGEGDDICFDYEDLPGVAVCWSVRRTAEGEVVALRHGSGEPFELTLGQERKQPLECREPTG